MINLHPLSVGVDVSNVSNNSNNSNASKASQDSSVEGGQRQGQNQGQGQEQGGRKDGDIVASDIADLELWRLQQAMDKRQAEEKKEKAGAGGLEGDVDVDVDVDLDIDLDLDDEGGTIKTIKVPKSNNGELPFNQLALQRYILHCAQNLDGGGMRDKPGKSRDFYHSCYSLSGLSLSQHFVLGDGYNKKGALQGQGVHSQSQGNEGEGSEGNGDVGGFEKARAEDMLRRPVHVLGDLENMLEPTSAVFNIGMNKLDTAFNHFYALGVPCTHAALALEK